MLDRRIAVLGILTVSLAGCFGDRFTHTNKATIEVNSLMSAQAGPILIDPRLKPEVNESGSAGNYWGDTTQKVVINSSGPLKLVPVTSGEADNLIAAEKSSQPSH